MLAFGGLMALVGGIGTTTTHHRSASRAPAHTATSRVNRTPIVPRDAVVLGAFIPGAMKDPHLISAYGRKTGRMPAIVEYFRNWSRGTFDEPTLRAVASRGAVPLITWEPWRRPLSDIAAGRYDGYLRSAAMDARRWRGQILVRFAHEMNGSWYPWQSSSDPGTYVRAWRHVVDVFRSAGAGNVVWVWAPNVDYGGVDLIRRLYPGDHWVDWVGLSGFSWGGPWAWQSVVDIFGRSYEAITQMTTKPMLIAETAAGEIGGNKAQWIKRTFTNGLHRLPRVRAVVWFNGQSQWARWDVDSTPAALGAFRDAIRSTHYAGTAQQVRELTSEERARAPGR